MAGIATVSAALLSFVSLVLIAIAMATNFWVRFDEVRKETPLNPIEENTQFSGLTVRYDLDYFGLWVGCHLAKTNENKRSCGYIGSSCYSNICWIRNDVDTECKDARVVSLSNCSALQATRAMIIIGTLFLILGSSVLVVSVCITSQQLTRFGALSTIIASLFLMIAFAVFYEENFRPLDEIAGIAWSFILLIVGWPIAFLAGIIGLLANVGEPKNDDDKGDYDDTE